MQKSWKRMLRYGLTSMLAITMLAGSTGLAGAQAEQTIHFTGYFDKSLRAQMATTADSFPVVNVRLVKANEPDMVYYDVGTSILISKDEVLTNYHVVQEFAELSGGDKGTLTVASPGALNQAVKAKIVKTDPVTDMALLKLDKPIDAEPVKFADARDNQVVYTIGFPKNPSGDLVILDDDFPSTYNTIAKSRVFSALASEVPGKVGIGSIVKAMAQGNSGGPVLDQNKQVIGMMTFVYGGRTYFISSKTLQTFVKEAAVPAKKPVVVAGKVAN
ncbi:serine protease [Paenibacillus polysaccharolyticus]|uniref:S1 family peptidase n=1 Tax=Paenibacillus TaxID=44249 RepID=UPI0012B86A80|nr:MULTISPECIES: serine protease [Paenibacillus]MCP1133038.1 serine protease [Paenibacillus polysaccharolyticus]